jgi:hypothetical protein
VPTPSQNRTNHHTWGEMIQSCRSGHGMLHASPYHRLLCPARLGSPAASKQKHEIGQNQQNRCTSREDHNWSKGAGGMHEDVDIRSGVDLQCFELRS